MFALGQHAIVESNSLQFRHATRCRFPAVVALATLDVHDRVRVQGSDRSPQRPDLGRPRRQLGLLWHGSEGVNNGEVQRI